MLKYNDADLWTACSAARSGAASGNSDARELNAAADMLIESPGLNWRELIGRSPRQGCAELTEEQAGMAGAYAATVIAGGGKLAADLAVGPITGGRAHWAPRGAVWRADWGWTIREPQADARLILSALMVLKPWPDQVELIIHQPRPHHPCGRWRKWTLSAPQLEQWTGWVIERATAAFGDQPPAKPGTQCTRCMHRSTCDALRRTAHQQYDIAMGTVAGERLPAALLAAELTHAQEAATIAAARLSGLQAEVEVRLLSGEWIPGYRLRDGEGNRELTVSPDVASLMLGLDAWRRVPRSPAELERMGADPETLKTITSRRNVGAKLVKTSDADAERIFNGR
jgi:hypothetical protein